MKLVIVAGGKGTRLKNVVTDIPKPMIKIDSIPILEHQINLAFRYGIKDITILTGYLSDVIEEYFRDEKFKKYNLKIIKEDTPLGAAGCFKLVEEEVDEDILVFYGDTMMDIDLNSFMKFHKDRDGAATLLVHPNDHPCDSDLIEYDEKLKIVNFHSRPHKKDCYYKNMVNAAMYIITPVVFSYIKKNQKQDFGKDIFPSMLKSGEKLHAYLSCEYIKDMGTAKRLEKVTVDYLSGKIERLNKEKPQKVIFIDRDGVINEEVNFLNNSDDFKLLDGVTEALTLINSSDYLAIVITNQPVVARGECSIETIHEIHKKMDTLLGDNGAYIDALYFCPHHPESGFEGEVKELKINCSCRKPNIGMLLQAKNDFNVDFKNSFFIGDTTVDIKTGENAKMKTILVNTGHKGDDKRYDVRPTCKADNLLGAVRLILEKK